MSGACEHDWTDRGSGPDDRWRECWLCGETEDAPESTPVTEGIHADPDGLTYYVNENGAIEPGTRHYPTTPLTVDPRTTARDETRTP